MLKKDDMADFNLSLQIDDVNVLSDAVRTWYRHNRAEPTEQSMQLLCSAAMDLYKDTGRARNLSRC
jgi:hypothetical protein